MALSIIPSTPGIFAYPTLQSALDRLSSHIQNRQPSPSHIQEILPKLLESLLYISSILPPHTQLTSPVLAQLRDISYSVDHLVDDIEYIPLQQDAEEFARSNPYEPPSGPSISQFRGFQTGESDAQNQAVSVRHVIQDGNEGLKPISSSHSKPKFKFLRSWIGKLCKCFDGKNDVNMASSSQKERDQEIYPLSTKVNPAEPKADSSEDALEDRIANMIVQLDTFATKCKNKFGESRSSSEVMMSFRIDDEVHGRDDEKEILIKMLLQSGDEFVSVVPIVGLGGIGKTTLAQYVYVDERVKKHFHAREWICASDTFDMMRIAGELEESLYLSGPYDQHQTLDLFQSNLKIELERKRFLLVLDDVRNIEWATRLAAIGTGTSGSKILLTTRDEEVLDGVSKRNMMILEGIKGEKFWSFFSRCSFGDVDPDKHPELQRIGKEIAEKLEGSPLAAKMVGGALRENLNDDHWRDISRSELWESRHCSGDVMPGLVLSYKHLPVHLQRCFAYCSVFPKGYAFDINKLVYMWTAHGLIRSASVDKSVEDIGREYFEHLLARSFFELPSYSKSYWRTKFYMMHELLHDLAESVCYNECFVYGSQGSEVIPAGVRHLSLLHSIDFNSVVEWGYIRTLIINTMHVTKFKVLKRVLVLDLSNSYMKELPDAIGHLTHLRYLNLSGNSIYGLPESLCKLYHLQTLLAPHQCRRLPKGIVTLINLRHLIASEEALSWIAGIGRLTCLQEFKVFNVRRTRGHDLGQLKGMAELRGLLCIQYLDDVQTVEEAVAANLKAKIHITRLQLKWMRRNRNRRPIDHEDVLECLQPPNCLEELEIHWYRGLQSPSWLGKESLHNLKSIQLRGCNKWNKLPPLGKLPFLMILKIEEMDAAVDGAEEAVDLFPSLEELWLENTSVTFESMETVHELRSRFFPSLHKLSVKNCDRLKGLPPLSMLLTLEELHIRKCPDLDAQLPDCLKHLTSLTKLSISELQVSTIPKEVFRWLRKLEVDSCPNLTFWMADENEENNLSSITSLCITNSPLPVGPVLTKHLTCLQELRLNHCYELNCLTTEQRVWFTKLTLLRELHITDCENLVSLPSEVNYLPSLENLTVAGCPKIKSLPTILPTSLRRLEISNCSPGLAIQAQYENAPEWVKHIPYMYIV